MASPLAPPRDDGDVTANAEDLASLPTPASTHHDDTTLFSAAIAAHAADVEAGKYAHGASGITDEQVQLACDVVQSRAERATLELRHADGLEPLETQARLAGTRLPANEPLVTTFHSKKYPPFQLRELAGFLCQRGDFEPEVIAYAIGLMLRYEVASNLPAGLTAHVIHRLFLTCVNLAHKILWDKCYSASTFAKISTAAAVEISRGEIHLLKACQWNIVLSLEEVRKAVSPMVVDSRAAIFTRKLYASSSSATTSSSTTPKHGHLSSPASPGKQLANPLLRPRATAPGQNGASASSMSKVSGDAATTGSTRSLMFSGSTAALGGTSTLASFSQSHHVDEDDFGSTPTTSMDVTSDVCPLKRGSSSRGVNRGPLESPRSDPSSPASSLSAMPLRQPGPPTGFMRHATPNGEPVSLSRSLLPIEHSLAALLVHAGHARAETLGFGEAELTPPQHSVSSSTGVGGPSAAGGGSAAIRTVRTQQQQQREAADASLANIAMGI